MVKYYSVCVKGFKKKKKSIIFLNNHSMHLSIKSINRFAYCSGCTVEISAPAPCFKVLAACAERFFIPYFVSMSIKAKKYISFFGPSEKTKKTMVNF